MAVYADIYRSIWTAPWFGGLDIDSQHLFLWAVGNDHDHISGLYQCMLPVVLLESKLTEARFDKALARLGGKVIYRRETGTVWVRSRVAHLRTRGDRMAKSIAQRVASCAHPDIQADFFQRYGHLEWLADALSDAIAVSPSIKPQSELQLDSNWTPREVLSPSPSSRGSTSENDNGSATTAREDAFPADLPPNLGPSAERCFEILTRVASAKQAKAVTRAGVGRAVASYPDRDHAKAAGDLEHWLCHGSWENKPVRDVVSYFRNQLDRAPVATRPALAAIQEIRG